MNYFVLFSVLLIAACVVILLVPSPGPTAEEGFTTHQKQRRNYPDSDPSAAGQRNASSHAGNADGTSDHDHLLDILLQKHDQLAEGFENREKKPQNTVSATTTKKKGIATTSASANASAEGDNVSIPVAGCNKNKCVEIGPTATDGEGLPIAFRGNCTNPKYYNSDYVNYRIKYCPAFKPVDDTIDDQECENCGYYTYYGVCIKKDPKKDVDPTDPKWAPTPENPSNCDYNDYQFNTLNYGPMPGGDQGQGDQGQGSSGPICSTCQLDTTTVDKCVLPGCYSADDGNMPFPDDDDYNFAEGCFDYNPKNKKLLGLENSPAGYYCPPITQGQPYDSGGSNGDACYTTDSALDYSKFRLMTNVCSNDKPKSKQQFKPENVDGNDDADGGNKRKRTASKMGAASSAINHQHQHTGAINVYHHHIHGSHGTIHNNNNNNKRSKRQGYMEPEAGASVLGFL